MSVASTMRSLTFSAVRGMLRGGRCMLSLTRVLVGRPACSLWLRVRLRIRFGSCPPMAPWLLLVSSRAGFRCFAARWLMAIRRLRRRVGLSSNIFRLCGRSLAFTFGVALLASRCGRLTSHPSLCLRLLCLRWPGIPCLSWRRDLSGADRILMRCPPLAVWRPALTRSLSRRRC